MNDKLQQALAKAKAKYEALGYTVITGNDELTATKGIYEVCGGYHDNEHLMYILNYKDGKQDGKQFWRNEDGTEKPTLVYKDGKFITEIISKQITYAEYKAIQRSKFWNGVFWIGSIVLFVGLFLADSCFEIKLFD